MTVPAELVQIITGFIGTCGFAVLFNVRGKRCGFVVLGGLISWSLFVLFDQFIASEAVNYFIVSFLMSIYAEILARILKTPASAFVTLALIPLIPGGSLYYTMAYAFEADLSRFIDKAVYTLQLAAALALGVIFATVLIRLLLERVHKLRTVGR